MRNNIIIQNLTGTTYGASVIVLKTQSSTSYCLFRGGGIRNIHFVKSHYRTIRTTKHHDLADYDGGLEQSRQLLLFGCL